MSSEDNRSTPGERTTARLLRREGRRPRLGLAPAFYARFGLEDPWQAPVDGPGEGLGYTFLSARPYYDMLRRLAAARQRREARMSDRLSRYQKPRLRAARRLWGDDRERNPLAFAGLSILSESALVYPEPFVPEAAVVEAQAAPQQRVVSGWTGKPVKSARSAWLSPRSATLPSAAPVRTPPLHEAMPAAPSPATPVAQRTARAERPLARVGQRLQVSATSALTAPLEAAVRASGGRVSRQLAVVIEEVAHLPAEEQILRVRRAARRMSGTSRLVREAVEHQLPDAESTPVSVAAGRMAPTRAQQRGLRPVMSSSPLMQAVQPPPPPRADTSVSMVSSPRLPAKATPTAAAARTATPRTPTAASRTPASRPAARQTPQASATRGTASTGGGDSGGAGLLGPPVASLRPAAQRQPPSAYTIARAALAPTDGAAVSAQRSTLPRVAPRPAVFPVSPEAARTDGEPVAPSLSAPSSVAPSSVAPSSVAPSSVAPSSVSRALWRARSGVARVGSVLPRAIAGAIPEEETATLRAERALRSGAERQTRAVQQAPQTQVLAPAPAPMPVGQVTADSTGTSNTRRPAWLSTRATENTPSRTSTAPTPQDAAARPAPRTARAEALSAIERVAVRHAAAEPTGRSLLPRVTRLTPEVAAHQAPSEAGLTRAAVGAPSAGVAQRALQREEEATAAVTPRPERVRGADGATRRPQVTSPSLTLPQPAVAASPSETAAPAERAVRPLASAWKAPSPVAVARQRAVTRTDEPGAPVSDQRAPEVRSARGATATQQRLAAVVAAAAREGRSSVVLESVQAALARDTARQSGTSAAVEVAVPRRGRAGPLGYVPRAAAPTQTVVVTVPSAGEARPSQDTPTAPRAGSVSIFSMEPAGTPATAPQRRSGAGARERQAAGGAAARPAAPVATPRPRVPVDRPLQRIHAREGAVPGAEGTATAEHGLRLRWAESRVAASPLRAPSLMVRSDGVVLQAPAQAPAEAEGRTETVRPQQRLSPWLSAARAPAAAGAVDEAADGRVPAPWSRTVWGRDRQVQLSSSMQQGSVSQTARNAGGLFMSRRALQAAGGFVFPSAEGTSDGGSAGAGSGVGAGAGGGVPAAVSGGSVWLSSPRRAERAPLPWTLEAVEVQSKGEGLPVWAQRASGAPRVRGSEDFLQALARASDVEEVVRVLFERSKEPRPMLRQVSSPVLQVIQQIREAAHQATVSAVVDGVLSAGDQLQAEQRRSRTAASGTTVQPRQARGEQARSSARVVRGMTGLRPMATAPRSEGVGDDKVMRLAARLRELIHLAEHKNRRDEARQGVRMAEDSASARAEGQGAPSQSEGGDGKKRQIDIDALAQEVLGLVQGELEGRRQRRPDNTGDDVFDVWW